MLQHRLIPSTRPLRSIRFASQLSQNLADVQSVKTPSGIGGSARKLSSILSRLSDRTQSGIRCDSEQNGRVEAAAAAYRIARPRTTSFVSAQSAQKRDHAAEKWFTDVRELNINDVDQFYDLKSPPRKQRTRSESPRHHEMRPRTDLDGLFAPAAIPSATSFQLETKREIGGDYSGYLPDGYADPYQLPITYARLVLGRNKYIPLNAQIGALQVVERAIRGKASKQVV